LDGGFGVERVKSARRADFATNGFGDILINELAIHAVVHACLAI